MNRVAVIAYAIEKGKGSESGSGYNFCRSLVTDPTLDLDLTIVTRRNNAELLRREPEFAEVHILGYDPPRWMTFWKRGPRNIIAYYYLWQWGIGRFLRKHGPFDAVHLYNFHTDWAPHFLSGMKTRIIWGPICHQPRLPGEFFDGLPFRKRVADLGRWLAKATFWALDPNLRRAASAADVILYANADVAPLFRGRNNVRFQTFGGGSFITPAPSPPLDVRRQGLRLLHVGRSVEIKGGLVALRAFVEYKRRGGMGKLKLVGEGPLRAKIEEVIASANLEDDVTIVDWMPQAELAKHYNEADVFLYPSMGNQDTVVSEALAAALPIVCIFGTGSATVAADAAVTVPRKDGEVASSLASRLLTLEEEYMSRHAEFAARRRMSLKRAQTMSWKNTARRVADQYFPGADR